MQAPARDSALRRKRNEAKDADFFSRKRRSRRERAYFSAEVRFELSSEQEQQRQEQSPS